MYNANKKEKIVDSVSNLQKLKIKVFTHNDLDGVSCAIILKKLYNKKLINFDFSFIDYSRISEIKDFLLDIETSRNYDFILITDISIKYTDWIEYIANPIMELRDEKNNFEAKDKLCLFKKLFIIDHHKDTEETLRRIEGFVFDNIEYHNDLEHCAAYQLADWCIHHKSRTWSQYTEGCEHPKRHTNESWVKEYIKLVNDWDLFKWKENNNQIALYLNLLFNGIRREKFTLMQEQKESPLFAFNKRETTIICEKKKDIERDFETAKMFSQIMPHINENGTIDHCMNYIVIKCDENVSLICDMIKEELIKNNYQKIFRIGYIVNVSFKYGAINFRRINDNIDLTKIARRYNGGGHPFAAGCPLNGQDEQLMNNFVNPILCKYGQLKKPYQYNPHPKFNK